MEWNNAMELQFQHRFDLQRRMLRAWNLNHTEYRARLDNLKTLMRLPNGRQQQERLREALLASPALLGLFIEQRQRARGIFIEKEQEELKEWQKSLSQEERNHLIDILLQPIYGTRDPVDISRKEVFYGELIARQHESEVYLAANSRTEYYHMLSERMKVVETEIKMELEEEQRRFQLARFAQFAMFDGPHPHA